MSYSEFDQEHDLDEREEAREAPPAPFWTVAIYLCGRAYGGPEEGGWWYDFGERVDAAIEDFPSCFLLTVWQSELTANEICKGFQLMLDRKANVGRRDIGSVLSTGRYYAKVYNGHPPKYFPERRPHYE